MIWLRSGGWWWKIYTLGLKVNPAVTCAGINPVNKLGDVLWAGPERATDWSQLHLEALDAPPPPPDIRYRHSLRQMHMCACICLTNSSRFYGFTAPSLPALECPLLLLTAFFKRLRVLAECNLSLLKRSFFLDDPSALC